MAGSGVFDGSAKYLIVALTCLLATASGIKAQVTLDGLLKGLDPMTGAEFRYDEAKRELIISSEEKVIRDGKKSPASEMRCRGRSLHIVYRRVEAEDFYTVGPTLCRALVTSLRLDGRLK